MSDLGTVVSQVTQIPAAWVQDVNNLVYRGLVPGQTTAAAVPSTAASISALRAFSKTGGSKVLVFGYYSSGDGGGGLYWYDSTDTTSADNGGTVIVASDGGRWKLATSGVVSVKQFGAKGDATTDDTAAIQAAVTYILGVRGCLYFPRNTAGDYYKITAPIAGTGATTFSIVGDGPQAVTLMGVGMSAGQYILDFSDSASDVVEQVRIEGITVRSLDSVPSGVRLKNVSYVLLKNVVVRSLTDGVAIDGSRCFTHAFEQLQGSSIAGSTVKWIAGFTGGGQFTFTGCTFTGVNSVVFPTTALADSLTFLGCNWEAHSSSGLVVNGTVYGVTILGSRTEAGGGVDFVLRPTGAGEYVGGVVIQGVAFSASNASSTNRVQIGGDAGKIRGFSVTGNIVVHGSDSFGGALVDLNGEGSSGTIVGNYLRGTTGNGAKVVTSQRAGVVVYGNENLSGILGEQWYSKPTSITYSASMTPDSSQGQFHTIVATNNTAFTINAPTNPPPSSNAAQILTLTVFNTSGGALGAVTWNAVFKMAAWTSPATGNNRSITFKWNGTNWQEISRTPSDVPN